MEKSVTNLTVHDNGTVEDQETGLVWMIPLAGEGWNGKERIGNLH